MPLTLGHHLNKLCRAWAPNAIYKVSRSLKKNFIGFYYTHIHVYGHSGNVGHLTKPILTSFRFLCNSVLFKAAWKYLQRFWGYEVNKFNIKSNWRTLPNEWQLNYVMCFGNQIIFLFLGIILVLLVIIYFPFRCKF